MSKSYMELVLKLLIGVFFAFHLSDIVIHVLFFCVFFCLQYTSSMRAKYLANSRPDPNTPPAH